MRLVSRNLTLVFLLTASSCGAQSAPPSSDSDAKQTHQTRVEKLPDGRIVTIFDRPGDDEDYAVTFDSKNPGNGEGGRWKGGKRVGFWANLISDAQRRDAIATCGEMKNDKYDGLAAVLSAGEQGRTANYVQGKAQGEYYQENILGAGAIVEMKDDKADVVKEYNRGELPAPKNGLRFFTNRSKMDIEFGVRREFEETAMTDASQQGGFWLSKTDLTWGVGKKDNGEPVGLWVHFPRVRVLPPTIFLNERDGAVEVLKIIEIWPGEKSRYRVKRDGVVTFDSGEIAAK